MVLTEEGYATVSGSTPTYYYYLKDHQGNNRVVINQSGAVQQVNHYYPFGGLFGEGVQTSNQPYKYNGKELDRFQSLDMYDYGARHYDAALGRWFTMDPLAEKYYPISPYVYVGNNPIRFIDPDGMWIDDIYYNEKGKEIYRVINDNPDRNFVIKTTQITDELYSNRGEERGFSSPISKEAASITELEISQGNLKGDHMKNVTQIASSETIKKMIDIIKDDGTGGAKAINNREYGGLLTDGKVKAVKSGDIGNPALGKNASINGDVDFHTHPSGTAKVKGGTASWVQPPSKTDIKTAIGKDYIFGMGSGIIYIYTKRGIIATIPMSTFK
jgi:RHS repeat-associated core domain